MTYNDEQRAIIARMGEISKRIKEASQHADRAHMQSRTAITDLLSALVTSTDSFHEIVTLSSEHGDAFREFLDTL